MENNTYTNTNTNTNTNTHTNKNDRYKNTPEAIRFLAHCRRRDECIELEDLDDTEFDAFCIDASPMVDYGGSASYASMSEQGCPVVTLHEDVLYTKEDLVQVIQTWKRTLPFSVNKAWAEWRFTVSVSDLDGAWLTPINDVPLNLILTVLDQAIAHRDMLAVREERGDETPLIDVDHLNINGQRAVKEMTSHLLNVSLPMAYPSMKGTAQEQRLMDAWFDYLGAVVVNID